MKRIKRNVDITKISSDFNLTLQCKNFHFKKISGTFRELYDNLSFHVSNNYKIK